MNLDILKAAVTSKAAHQILLLKKNSPSIMFTAGVVGVVGSTVLACKATLKLDHILHEHENTKGMIENVKTDKDYSEEDRKRDKMLLLAQTAGRVTKIYAPAVGIGVVSVGLLTGSHVTLNRRNASLMAAYSTLDKGFKEYRARVRDELGDEKDAQFRYGTEVKKKASKDEDGTEIDEYDLKTGVEFPSIYARFFDDQSQYWSREQMYNQFFLNSHQNYFNDRLKAKGHVFLNEVFDALGIPRCKEGAVVGWLYNGDGDNFIDFGMHSHDYKPSRMFTNGEERSILLDFNVDGVIYDKI